MKSDLLRGRSLVLLLVVGVGACSAGETESKRPFDFSVTKEASASDVGLPAYPGSIPYQDDDKTSPAAKVGISTPLFEVKVAAVKLETSDEPDRVAAFYKSAIAQYGTVVICGDVGNNKNASASDTRKNGELMCNLDDLKTHKLVYKVGTENDQHVVAIKAHGSGTRFSLVHVDVHG